MRVVRQDFTARYLVALRSHLKRKIAANGDRAQGLGRAALVGGWATRDLALMHEKAVVLLAASFDFARPQNDSLKRAGFFFTQALIPLEAAQRATTKTNRRLKQRNETLRLHTAVLITGNRRLEHEITRRRAGEVVIRKGKSQYETLFAESQVMQRKLRQLTRQIISAQEDERREISRELHDEVVQTLVGINVQLSALGRGASAGLHGIKAEINHTQRLVENSVNAVHRFARELRPAVLDDLGLIPALHAYCRSLAERTKMKINLTAFSGVESVGDAEKTVLFRVAQEALTNVVRHAHATKTRLRIEKLGDTIRMEICDNGKSFQVKKTIMARNTKRLGLIGMRERIEMVGGELTIASTLGEGTKVTASIPYNSEKKQHEHIQENHDPAG